MPKISQYFFVFFLALVGPGVCVLQAGEPLTKQGGVSQTLEETAPFGISNTDPMSQENVRNPFAVMQPPVPVAAPVEVAPVEAGAPPVPPPTIELTLQGIGKGGRGNYAIIGGEVYYEGDEKNGVKLLEVRYREVDIIANGGILNLRLYPNADLKKVMLRSKQRNPITDNAVLEKNEPASSPSGREQLPL